MKYKNYPLVAFISLSDSCCITYLLLFYCMLYKCAKQAGSIILYWAILSHSRLNVNFRKISLFIQCTILTFSTYTKKNHFYNHSITKWLPLKILVIPNKINVISLMHASSLLQPCYTVVKQVSLINKIFDLLLFYFTFVKFWETASSNSRHNTRNTATQCLKYLYSEFKNV